MKKHLLMLSVAGAFFFASCDDKNTTNPEPLGTVTIKGAIVSNLDEDDDPDDFQYLEKIPADVTLYFKDNTSGALLATTKTTADGYTVDIQISGPRTISLIVGDFQTSINTDIDGDGDYDKVNAVYNEREHVEISVVKGGTYIQDLQIDQPTPIEF